MGPTKAAAKLRDITTPRAQYTRAEIAKACDVTESAVGMWVRGEIRPDPDNIKKLKEFGIDVGLWFEDEEPAP